MNKVKKMPRITNRRYSQNIKTKPHWHATNVISGLDHFAKELPAFNVKGETKVNTFIGGFISLVIMTVTLGYAIGSWIELVERSNPIINESFIANYYGHSDEFNLNQ